MDPKQFHYDYILDNMVDGLFTVDSQRVITFWNKAAETILGYKKEEVIGKTCDILNSPNCSKTCTESGECLCPLFLAGTIGRKRCTVTAKDGSMKHLLKNAVVLRNEQGEIIGGIENIVDITEHVEREAEIDNLKKQMEIRSSFCRIIGSHCTMQTIYDLIDLARDSDATILISGESGTGKELVANAIHYSSPRKNGPLVKVNCAALAQSLLESELFGHVRGAFTDAIRDRKGRFEEADGGTIFLDEIGDLPAAVQVKLLRVLQDKEIQRVGDNSPFKVDVRIIAATNKDIPQLIEQGLFREDLYYRLNVIPVRIPPLKNRSADIPLLVHHLMKNLRQKTGKRISQCDPAVMDAFIKYSWPGNVRELENAIEYAFVTCRGRTIGLQNIPEHIVVGSAQAGAGASGTKQDSVKEKARVEQALEAAQGNRTKAAQLLSISRVALWKKMKKLGMIPAG